MRNAHGSMIASLILVLAVVIYRVVFAYCGGPSGDSDGASLAYNFAPLAALFFCSALFLPKNWALVVPFAALLVSDLILNHHYGVALLSAGDLIRYAAFGAVLAIGFGVKKAGGGWAWIVGGTVGSSVLFYLVTNTASWFVSAAYAKTLAGWAQALTLGTPGFPPTLLFFRNSLISDLLFTGLFVLCWKLTEKRATRTETTTSPGQSTHADPTASMIR